MIDSNRAVELAVQIAETAKHVERWQNTLRSLARELSELLAVEEKPARRYPWVDKVTVIPIRSLRGRAGDAPTRVIQVLAAMPQVQWKPRELAQKLGMSGTQARSLGITLLRMRKEGRVRFHGDSKTYSAAA